jgi:hypothetical protein
VGTNSAGDPALAGEIDWPLLLFGRKFDDIFVVIT